MLPKPIIWVGSSLDDLREFKEEMKKLKAKISTKSVYADLGYKNHEEMETKANLTMEIGKTIKKKKLTQTKAAKLLGISQPKLSDLLRGHFRGYSVERLMNFLTELGKDVNIVIKNQENRKGRVKVFSNEESHRNVPFAAANRSHH